MDKIYLPEKLVIGQEEKDLHPYHRRVSTSFCVAFTLNEPTQMNTGNRYKDNLDACLTAVSWVEDNYCVYNSIGISANNPNYDRIVKTCTFYMDRGGYIVSGHYQEMKYNVHSVDNALPKKIKLVHNFRRSFISSNKDNILHKEIFLNNVFKIQGFQEFKINAQSDFYKLLQSVSIYNRSMDMSFVFSIAQERKEQLEKFKKIVGIISIPIAIEGYAWAKSLFTAISLINYLCTVDDVMKLSEELFKFRGPVVISDVYDKVYINQLFDPQRNFIPQPHLDANYLSSDTSSKISALNRFKEISTVIGNKIKTIKEPITEVL